MITRFDGQAVLVTGAGHGIGRQIAFDFARLGAHVSGADVNDPALEEGRTLAAEEGLQIDLAHVDVTDRDAVEAWVLGWHARHGRLDVAVHSAGGVLGQVGRPVEEVPAGDWRSIVAVNLEGAFHLAAAATPTFKAQRSGRIVHVSSGAGLGVSLTGIQSYASAKAGLIGLTRQLAHELGPWNVTVNCIAPGFVRSNPTTERQWESYGEEGQRRLVASVALRRLGTAKDISNGVLFFASEHAAWVTGQTLSVDGGK